ncbi:MAG: site-specific DNA-methyltransferase [Acidimicrobiales bacterium]
MSDLTDTSEAVDGYVEDEASGDGWTMKLGDSCERLAEVDDATVDLSIYSPPFASLYTYSPSPRDIGNCMLLSEFLAHYRFVVAHMMRVTKPGRLTAVHLAQVATQLAKDGVIGLTDLRGAVIAAYVAEGWVYHGDITVDKNPQAQAIRTHSKALLFVQMEKDSTWSRPALADYVLLFRKPGDNAVPVTPVANGDVTREDWIRWASPCWYDIRESDTLNAAEGRSEADERHICPLQLPLIDRCVRLWSNPGELVLSPFGGIGSEGVGAIRTGRRYLGIELKPSYFATAVSNLRRAEHEAALPALF